MLTCKQIVENAGDYIGKASRSKNVDARKMSFKEKMELMLHRMMCPSCRRFLRYFEVLYSSSEHFKSVEISEEKVDEIVSAVKIKAKK